MHLQKYNSHNNLKINNLQIQWNQLLKYKSTYEYELHMDFF